MDCVSGPGFPSTISRRSSNGLSQREKDVLSLQIHLVLETRILSPALSCLVFVISYPSPSLESRN